MNKVISVAVATALGFGVLAGSPGAQAKPASTGADSIAAATAQSADYMAYRGKRYGHVRGRGYGRAAGAAAAVGIAGALIGGAIAAEHSRRYGYYDEPYGYDDGYGPRYGYRY